METACFHINPPKLQQPINPSMPLVLQQYAHDMLESPEESSICMSPHSNESGFDASQTEKKHEPSWYVRSKRRLTRQSALEIYLIKVLQERGNCDPRNRIPAVVVARRYSVTEKTVRDIWCGRTWRCETAGLLDAEEASELPHRMRPIGRPRNVDKILNLGQLGSSSSEGSEDRFYTTGTVSQAPSFIEHAVLVSNANIEKLIHAHDSDASESAGQDDQFVGPAAGGLAQNLSSKCNTSVTTVQDTRRLPVELPPMYTPNNLLGSTLSKHKVLEGLFGHQFEQHHAHPWGPSFLRAHNSSSLKMAARF
mmetsp:Transcript_46799/g.124343  ORF Transcript_46799/g.124343 Transcript_46799/m.124343 type:complete len:308 (+) Transcript_46799:1-924(+)